MKLEPVPINENTFNKLIKKLNKIKTLHPMLRPYLRKEMTAGFCKKNYKIPHHKEGEVVKNAYYIGTGFIILFYEVDGKRYVVGICGADEILAGSGFMQGTAAGYSIQIVKGS